MSSEMDMLPMEVQIVVYKDALLMHVWQRHRESLRNKICHLWAKVVYYERQWPGSATACSVALS